jgi:hypothetical protein
MDKVTVSWVLYSLREVLGYEHIRTSILKNELVYAKSPSLIYGPTFAQEYNPENLKSYLSSILKLKNKRVLFTASNLPDLQTQETHYQTYIVDTSNKTVLMIDPARKVSGKGIYPPIVSREVVRPYFENAGYTVSWIDTSSACQIKLHDVFCQSWSLYLQIQATLNPGLRVEIPKSQKAKYELLLNFFHKIIAYPDVCLELQNEFKALIKDTKPHVITAVEKKYMLVQDPCLILRQMTPSDMFDDDIEPGNNHPLAVTVVKKK